MKSRSLLCELAQRGVPDSGGSGLCSGELDQAAVEEASQGTFIDLRKAFFLLPAAEAPLVSKVSDCS